MLRPLTRRRTSGELYRRRSEVEALLGALTSLPRDELLERLRITARSDPDFVPAECVVYLLREADANRDGAFFDRLFMVLDNRCRRSVARSVRAGLLPDAETAREEVLGAFYARFADFLRTDPERLDPYEVAFDKAFAALRADVLRAERRHDRRKAELPGGSHNDESDADAEREFRQPEAANDFGMTDAEFAVFRKQVDVAIGNLPPEEREPIKLRLEGLPIDAKDPNADTIAKRLGVDERTVRNRINRGVERLQQMTKGTQP